MAQLALDLSDSLVLPFDIVEYANFLERDLAKLERQYSNLLIANGASFGNSFLDDA